MGEDPSNCPTISITVHSQMCLARASTTAKWIYSNILTKWHRMVILLLQPHSGII